LLLQVLEEASVAEVVDVSTDEHQVGVYVVGHTAVGWHGVGERGRHHRGGGGVGTETLLAALYQGTKSGDTRKTGHLVKRLPSVSMWALLRGCDVFLNTCSRDDGLLRYALIFVVPSVVYHSERCSSL